MHPSVKAVLQLLVILGAIGSIFAWSDTPVDVESNPWPMRIGTTLATLAILGILVKAEFKKDKVPDYLARAGGTRLEVDGFSFVLGITEGLHGLTLVIHYQLRHTGPGSAYLVLSPTKELIGAVKMEPIELSIPFGPAEVGVVQVPFAAPDSASGRHMRLDIAGAVDYPNGRGKLLRFKDGLAVKAPRSHAGQLAHAALTLVASVPGASEPTRIKMQLPRFGIALPNGPFPQQQQMLWRWDGQEV